MPKSERVQKPDRGGARPAPAPASSQPAPGASLRPNAARLLSLQRTAGNRAVQRIVNASKPPVQRIGDEDEAPADAGAAAASGYGVYKAAELPAADAGGGGAAAAGGGGAGGAAAAVTGPGGLAPLSLPAKYHGEDREVGWRATFGMNESTPPAARARAEAASHGTSLVTKYNTPEETAANTLKPAATADGGKALTTAGGDVASTKPVEYAMSPAGQVVANLGGQQFERDAAQRRNIHHSTMLAGGDVAHAGHIGVAGGQVNYLDDDSGHYRPDEAHTYAAFNELADQGVLNKDSATGRVKMVDKSKEKGMGQGAAASVHFSGYQQAQGNEQAIRRRGAVMDELLKTRARYEGPPSAAEAAEPPAIVYDPDAADAAPAAAASPGSYSAGGYTPLSGDALGMPPAGASPYTPMPAGAAPASPGSYSAGGYTPLSGDALGMPPVGASPYTPMPAGAAPASPYSPMPAGAAPASPYSPMPAGAAPASPYSPMPAGAAPASPYSPMPADAAPASPYSPMPADAAPASPYSPMPADAASPYGPFPMDREQ